MVATFGDVCLSAVFAWARLEAATDFSAFVDFGSLRALLALVATVGEVFLSGLFAICDVLSVRNMSWNNP